MELTAIRFNSESEELEPAYEYYLLSILLIFDHSGSNGPDRQLLSPAYEKRI